MDNTNLPQYSQSGYGLTEEDAHIGTGAHSVHASLSGSCWSSSQVSSVYQNPIFPVQSRVSDLDYPSPAPSAPSPPYQRQSQQHPAVNSSAITVDKAIHTPFLQVESVIGPDRILTRRQRAALEQTPLGRRLSVPSSYSRTERQDPVSRHRSALYFTPSSMSSRPQTPVNVESTKMPSQRDRLSLNITDSNALLQNHSPGYKPMTPTSLSSPYSPYPYYTNHSRSEPSVQPAIDPRPESPSNSITSSMSLSGAAYETVSPRNHVGSPAGMHTRVKHKKQRLCNAQRKEICEYAEKHPNARQEDMAILWKVERSTVSKILKNRDKWLRLPDDEYNGIVKHRYSKFPEIEADLIPWLMECSNKDILITDSLIRAKAKEVAQKHHISEDRFKASSGWIENFKLRQGVKSGKLVGHAGRHLRIRRPDCVVNERDPYPDPSPPTNETDQRLTSTSLAFQHASWPSFTQSDRASMLDGGSIMQGPSTPQDHITPDEALHPQYQTHQQLTSSYAPDSVPTLEESHEILGRLRHFLRTYHRREFLLNSREEDMLSMLAQRFTKELAGTLIDKP
ncbi:hypothetical protein AX17_005022 [Amanita inopinata Kibby_2008]|nr:hypothetical protein AX17_005022 [Amanita inopinata Kibby_2008]